MIEELHIKPNNDNIFVPEEGQRGLMCSNKKSFRCPSSGIKINNQSEEAKLDYFASIIVQAFLDKKEHERKQSNNSQESDNIHEGINYGAIQ